MRRCSRCNGQIVRTWDELVCLSCGHVVEIEFTDKEIARARLEFLADVLRTDK